MNFDPIPNRYFTFSDVYMYIQGNPMYVMLENNIQ